MATSVAILGTGRLGAALARTLLDDGAEVVVWNRTTARAAALVEHGARVARSPADAVEGADLVVLCLLDDAAVGSVLGEAGMTERLASRPLLDLATVLPAEARARGLWACRHGLRYLPGALFAYDEKIGTPDALIGCSGDEALFATVRELLAPCGSFLYLGADAGLAAAAFLATVPPYHGALLGVVHGAALAAAEGVPVERFVEVLRGFLPTIVLGIENTADRIADRRFTPPHASVGVNAAASRIVVEACEALGIDGRIAAAHAELLRRAADQQEAEDQDVATLITMIRSSD